jgi:hypothetical protein
MAPQIHPISGIVLACNSCDTELLTYPTSIPELKGLNVQSKCYHCGELITLQSEALSGKKEPSTVPSISMETFRGVTSSYATSDILALGFVGHSSIEYTFENNSAAEQEKPEWKTCILALTPTSITFHPLESPEKVTSDFFTILNFIMRHNLKLVP